MPCRIRRCISSVGVSSGYIYSEKNKELFILKPYTNDYNKYNKYYLKLGIWLNEIYMEKLNIQIERITKLKLELIIEVLLCHIYFTFTLMVVKDCLLCQSKKKLKIAIND